jgi:hypothetical protein
MKKIKFKMRKDGVCLTKCPYNVKCKVNSMTCVLCLFFNKQINDEYILCNADKIF